MLVHISNFAYFRLGTSIRWRGWVAVHIGDDRP